MALRRDDGNRPAEVPEEVRNTERLSAPLAELAGLTGESRPACRHCGEQLAVLPRPPHLCRRCLRWAEDIEGGN
jgi:hypothetical protein